MKRRTFIKSLLTGAAAVPFIKELDIPELGNNLDGFTDEELNNISKIETIEVQDYTPYFHVAYDNGENIAQEYMVKMKDGTVFYYADSRELKNRFGDILDYWNLPSIHSPSGKWHDDLKGEWL